MRTLKELVAQSLLLDLVGQDWQLIVEGDAVSLLPPSADDEDSVAQKRRVRDAHLVGRNAYLRQRPVQEFVSSMEQRRLTSSGWHSIFSLMRDGRDLATKLGASGSTVAFPPDEDRLCNVIAPYVQVAEPGTVCAHTGLDLGDVWRYFRLTWVNEPKSVPGRSMTFLVRDSAAPNHPVIGIAALGSSVVQQHLRDRWIGWEPLAFVERLAHEPSTKLGRWLLETLERHIDALYVSDLVADGIVTRREITSPTAECIVRLREEGVAARKAHELYPAAAQHKRSADDWKAAARRALFRAKRCETLGRLLTIQLAFRAAGLMTGGRTEVITACKDTAFKASVGQLVRLTKAEHVGIDMMDITVCGAVAPYTHLLGGKLVCILLCSPEIVVEHRRRYSEQESIIASSMKGASVRRSPRLVLLGTTSLYAVGASQYNRVRIPLDALGGESGEDLRYEKLGLSKGYGSFHVSTTTVRLINMLLSRRVEGRRVNSIFGEGVNPLMRKIREALELLGLPSDAVLLHGNQRVVYGVPLARNFREVLLGLSERPSYFLQMSHHQEATEALAAFWRRRWLAPRIGRPGILEAVAQHTLSYPVQHGARVAKVGAEAGESEQMCLSAD